MSARSKISADSDKSVRSEEENDDNENGDSDVLSDYFHSELPRSSLSPRLSNFLKILAASIVVLHVLDPITDAITGCYWNSDLFRCAFPDMVARRGWLYVIHSWSRVLIGLGVLTVRFCCSKRFCERRAGLFGHEGNSISQAVFAWLLVSDALWRISVELWPHQDKDSANIPSAIVIALLLVPTVGFIIYVEVLLRSDRGYGRPRG